MLTLPLLALMLLSDPAAAAGSKAPLSWSSRYTVGEKAPPGSNFRYDYAEGAILLGDFDGVRGGVSKYISGQWIALGRLDYLTEEEGSADIDITILSGGAGYVHTLEDERFDLIGSAEIEIAEAEVDAPGGGGDDDDIGLRLRGGARFRPDDRFELAGGVTLSTIFDEDLGFDVQGLYDFNEKFAGFVGFDVRDDTVATIGVRFFF
jgi:hypothetical protein